MATRWARVFRGLVVSLLAAFVAGFAHVVGGGSIPSVAGAALVFSLCVPASILLAGRTISTVRLAIAVGLSQGGFHLLFWLTGDSSSTILPRAAAGMHGMTGMSAPTTVTSMSGLHGASVAGPMSASGWMWMAHGLAAVLTLIALRYGEGAFWAFVAAARVTIIRFVKSIVLTLEFPRTDVVGLVVRVDRRDAPFLSSGLKHRGPPVLALASS